MKQSQESLYDQLKQAIDLCNKNGLYDAADYIKNMIDIHNRLPANRIPRRGEKVLILNTHDADEVSINQIYEVEEAWDDFPGEPGSYQIKLKGVKSSWALTVAIVE